MLSGLRRKCEFSLARHNDAAGLNVQAHLGVLKAYSLIMYRYRVVT